MNFNSTFNCKNIIPFSKMSSSNENMVVALIYLKLKKRQKKHELIRIIHFMLTKKTNNQFIHTVMIISPRPSQFSWILLDEY